MTMLLALWVSSVAAVEPAELDKRCDSGEPAACVELGDRTARGDGVEMDLTRAVALFQRACEANYLRGCTALLSLGIESVTGVAGLSLVKVQQLCSGGDVASCSQLAQAYSKGQGVGRDRARAVTLWVQSCELGGHEGCHQAAEAFRWGRGVSQDAERAAALYRRACEGGWKPACTHVR